MDDQSLVDLVSTLAEKEGGVRALASSDEVAFLRSFDHHAVSVGGRRGVLLTFHLLPRMDQAAEGAVFVIFAHAEQHPEAPPEVQRVIDTLEFAGV